MIHLDNTLILNIIKIITAYKACDKIILFGSRATETFQETSDIDLAVLGAAWTDRDINLTRHALEEELKTPLKIDLVHFDALSKEQLKTNILKNGVVIYDQTTD